MGWLPSEYVIRKMKCWGQKVPEVKKSVKAVVELGRKGYVKPRVVLCSGGIGGGLVGIGCGEKKEKVQAVQPSPPKVEKVAEAPKGVTETEERLTEYLGAAERVVNHPEGERDHSPRCVLEEAVKNQETAVVVPELGLPIEEKAEEPKVSRRRRRRMKREPMIQREGTEGEKV